MHDCNRCEEIKWSVRKAVGKGREMVGEKDSVRRRMALDETTGRVRLSGRARRALSPPVWRETHRAKNHHEGSIDMRGKGRRGKSRHFIIINFDSSNPKLHRVEDFFYRAEVVPAVQLRLALFCLITDSGSFLLSWPSGSDSTSKTSCVEIGMSILNRSFVPPSTDSIHPEYFFHQVLKHWSYRPGVSTTATQKYGVVHIRISQYLLNFFWPYDSESPNAIVLRPKHFANSSSLAIAFSTFANIIRSHGKTFQMAPRVPWYPSASAFLSRCSVNSKKCVAVLCAW